MAKRHKIKFMTHVPAFLPCSVSTFYALELEKSEALKDIIFNNRTSSKVKTLNKWEESENATLQVAYMKLIADEDEADRLNGSKQKLEAHHTHSVDEKQIERVNKIYDRIGKSQA